MANAETKVCQNCRQSFVIEPDDFSFYEKIKVPPPTFCPDCRLQRRLMWRNERSLYKRTCNAPGHNEEMISYVAPEKPYTVYCQKYFWSDAWDPMYYGAEYDFSKPFFLQLKELFARTPRASLTTNYGTMVNSDYSNWAGDCKNCYLVTDADHIEDSGYSSGLAKSKDCYDCNTISDSQLCYEGFNLNTCYNAVGSVNCHECSDILFCKSCVGCNNCFGSINLRNKSYYIFNKPYTKETYHQELQKLGAIASRKNFERLRKEAENFWLQYPHKNLRGIKNVNSFGDYIYNCKNVRYGYFVQDAEDSKYVSLIHSPGTKDCFDYTDWGEGAELIYESEGVGLGAFNVAFSNLVWNASRDAAYSLFCRNSSNIFGCASLRNKQYCILNKQYMKEEYEALVPKIIEHMNATPYTDAGGRVYEYGEYFPPELCVFDYNESMAQELFPLTEGEAKERKLPWRPRDTKTYTITKTADALPDTIAETGDEVLKETIGCRHGGMCGHNCTTAFRIIQQELQFYRKMNLPLPTLCPNCRHWERLKHRNPPRLWHRTCQCAGSKSENSAYENAALHFHEAAHCPNEFQTSYAPDRPETVYCEQCYQAEVA